MAMKHRGELRAEGWPGDGGMVVGVGVSVGSRSHANEFNGIVWLETTRTVSQFGLALRR